VREFVLQADLTQLPESLNPAIVKKCSDSRSERVGISIVAVTDRNGVFDHLCVLRPQRCHSTPAHHHPRRAQATADRAISEETGMSTRL
jgi:hypothetical protein